jgi:hypothetical protein
MTGTREEKVSGKEEGLLIQAPEGGETRESTYRKNTCWEHTKLVASTSQVGQAILG